MFFLNHKRTLIIVLILVLLVSLSSLGYFYFAEKDKKGILVDTEGVRVTTKIEERKYESLFGVVKEKRDEDTILIENEGEEEWVKINPNRILISDYEQEATASADGSRTVSFKTIPFPELNTGDKVTIYNLVEKGGSTLHGEKVMVWKDYYGK